MPVCSRRGEDCFKVTLGVPLEYLRKEGGRGVAGAVCLGRWGSRCFYVCFYRFWGVLLVLRVGE